ncbi:hypothetical protein PAE9249_03807 [Paenibacillus sp. CECT 9249]|nr:hypothetical protein PAE9249_03807 [Paenibacillus sp. CECT 9249]
MKKRSHRLQPVIVVEVAVANILPLDRYAGFLSGVLNDNHKSINVTEDPSGKLISPL